jgi:hypothetical protein
MWSVVPHITTGIALAAFIAAVAAWTYRAILKRKERLIRTAPESERAALVESSLEFFRVDTSGLTKTQKYDLALEQIRARERRFLTAAKVISFIATLFALAVVSIYTIAHLAPANSKGHASDNMGADSKDQPPEKPLYAAEVGAAILNPGQFWAVYRVGTGEMVAPIDSLIGHIVIVNLQDRPVSLNSVSLEISNGSGWMQLRRIPLNGVTLYMGPLNRAAVTTGIPGDLNSPLVNAEIPPGKTIRGMGIFEYSDPNFRTTGTVREKIRVTITDTAKHRVQLTDTDPEEHKAGVDDPFGSTEQSSLTFTGPPADLSILPMRRFLPPSQEPEK